MPDAYKHHVKPRLTGKSALLYNDAQSNLTGRSFLSWAYMPGTRASCPLQSVHVEPAHAPSTPADYESQHCQLAALQSQAV